MNANELTNELRNSSVEIYAEQISERTMRVIAPTFRNSHDSVAFGVTRTEAGWIISDGGQLGFTLEGDLVRVIDAMECAGAAFALRGEAVEFDVDDADALPGAVMAFAYYMAATPIVWHAIDCARQATSEGTRIPSVELMARETRSHIIEHVGPRSAGFLHLRHNVSDHGERFPAPLAVGIKGSFQRPKLVASFLDTSASPASLTTAKRNTSHLFRVIRDWSDTRKYVVVRGDRSDVDHYAEFYDRDQVVAVSTEDHGPLYDDVREAVDELVTL